MSGNEKNPNASPRISRRKFVRRSALTGGALLIAGEELATAGTSATSAGVSATNPLTIAVNAPPAARGELVVRRGEKIALEVSSGGAPSGHCRYLLPPAATTTLNLNHV